MEILVYLPTIYKAYTRVHIDPLLLPERPDNDSDDNDTSEEELMDNERKTDALAEVTQHEDYGNCLAQLYHRDGCLRFCSKNQWNFLTVLRVCKRWGAVARECPEFWSTIIKYNDHTIEESIRLSGNLPLHVGYDSAPWPSVRSLMTTLTHLPRIRFLDLSCSAPDTYLAHSISWISGYFEVYSAALLESLSLDFSNTALYSLHTTAWIQKTFPILRELDLRSVHLSLPCALLSPSLTDLSLIRCVAPWKTTAEFIRVLDSLPLLVNFTIAETEHPPDLGHHDRPNVADVSLPVCMRYLNLLEFQGSLLCTSRLLTMLQTPATVDMELEYEHHALAPNIAQEIIDTYTVFEAIGDAIPEDAYFSAMTLDVDLLTRSIEFSFGCLENPSERACSETMVHKHTWSVANDTDFPFTWAFIHRIAAPFLPRVTQVPEISINISLQECNPVDNLHFSGEYFTCVLNVTGLTYLLLSSDAVITFIPWLVRLMYIATTLVEAALNPQTIVHLRQPLPFPHLTRLRLSNCDLSRTVFEDDWAATDGVLFSYLWLYFQAQKPVTQLIDIQLSKPMLDEVCLLLDAQLDCCLNWSDPREMTHISVRRTEDSPMEKLIVTAGEFGENRTTSFIVAAS